LKKLLLAALLAFPLLAQGQYPSKPMRAVVAFGTGAATDVIARMISAPMSQSLGQLVVIDNKPGADGMIAGGDVVRSAPDDYIVQAAHIRYQGPAEPNPAYRAVNVVALLGASADRFRLYQRAFPPVSRRMT
jgi:tripartite-type tricarboxylate transporter receptor subunit TctC